MGFQDLINEINEFRDERAWRQFHTAKDLALSVSLEAAELLELFQWKTSEDAIAQSPEQLAEELADILIYCLMLADDLNLDPETIIERKIEINRYKYPIEKSYGRSTKYSSSEKEAST